MTGILLFVKNLRLGKVKTRLANDVGDARALAIYSRLRDQAQYLCERVGDTRWVFFDTKLENTPTWDKFKRATQYDTPDLGLRMHHAFQQAFEAGCSRVLLLGSDCPYIQQKDLEKGLDLLQSHDVVLGPAEDGGYYLIGLTAPSLHLFEHMTWSVDSVAQETQRRAQAAGQRLALLPTYSDIDYFKDWQRYRGLD